MNRSFNAVRELGTRTLQSVQAKSLHIAVGSLALLPVLSHAALDPEATAIFTGAAVAFALILAAAYVLAAVVTGGWITFDMVKKGAKKAAK